MKLDYSWMPGSFALVDSDLLEECATLYSNHYGLWSDRSSLPGRRVRLSSKRLREWLDSKDARITLARSGSELVGYAIAVQTKAARCGVVSWVTQLVVHERYRRQDVGKTLLFSIWGLSDHYAWGLLTANPYAVRALEKATRRRCLPNRIQKSSRKLYQLGLAHVPYVTEGTEFEVHSDRSRIRTDFFLDHSELEQMLRSATTDGKPWRLGPLQEGWEWLAFTFSDQDQILLSPREISSMLEASDQITRQAYSRMRVNDDHFWARYAAPESRQIMEHCRLEPGHSVLDFGCGAGRHAIELARAGVRVTGVDYVGAFVEKAEAVARQQKVSGTRFVEADCRTVKLDERFDAALCLYDVVGTYADRAENTDLLVNLASHLKPGGCALVSVMNLTLTRRRARHVFSMQREPNRLLDLPPSRIMETTGDIFDPDFYMLDEDANVVYRKEQFTQGQNLPAELIVRDRRFLRVEIEAMCAEAGLDVAWTRFVRAGRWDDPLDEQDDRAKEILVLCRARR